MKSLIIVLLVISTLALWLIKKRKDGPLDVYNPLVDEIPLQVIDIKDIVEWFIINKKDNDANAVGIVLDLTKVNEISDLIQSNIIYSVLMKQIKLNSKARLLLCYYNKNIAKTIDDMPMTIMHGESLSSELISQFGDKPLIIIE